MSVFKQLSRRTFLRGAGVAIALPILDAMVPAMARAQARAPRRMLAFYVPNGMHMPNWTPSTTGAGYTLPPILEPLAAVKGDLLVLTNLANRPGRPDGNGDHAAGTASFLTARHAFKTEGANISNGISVDQVLANAVGAQTRFNSLQLGTDGGATTGDCDSGYSCAYARNISWAGPSTPLAKEVNPRAVFDRLFQGQTTNPSDALAIRRRLLKQSVLDFVREDAQTLRTKLGKTDQIKVDEYLTGVREIERRLEPIPVTSQCSGTAPASSSDFRARVRAMSDLMVLAFQCDLTRSISFMLGNAGSQRVYDFLGMAEPHHEISHHQNADENHRKLTAIARWEVEQLAYVLGRMKAVQESDGTLLDNSVVFFSSEIEDGNSHAHTNLPVILAGGGGGMIRPGRHVRYTREQPMANLFISMLRATGVEATSFGDDGVGPLSDLA